MTRYDLKFYYNICYNLYVTHDMYLPFAYDKQKEIIKMNYDPKKGNDHV
jgi:hypothetical protein